MLRSLLIYLSQASWARQLVTRWEFARRAASRFIAGEELDDAIGVVKSLNRKNINATLDHLGEHTTNPEKARQATEDIIEILSRIEREGVRSNVSIKLTQIGLAVDEALCVENLQRILDTAVNLKTFVRIDMEDSQWVEKTLNIFHEAQDRCSCENVGIVIQSYLFRSEEDVARLLQTGSRIRLCKGAYKEPEEIAFPEKSDVDANFDLIVSQLLNGSSENSHPTISADGKIPPIPAIATHDEKRIVFTKKELEKSGYPKNAVEFQMLHGIRRDLQESLASEGYPVRVYVPYGSEWYPYFTRRLAERPANLWFFISNFFR
ncbi:MAG: proline dehydrogenase family protein [Chloroflexota bacterium]|nr:MAG: proline dehydrogenase family protein [Chloroflexota bacterium]